MTSMTKTTWSSIAEIQLLTQDYKGRTRWSYYFVENRLQQVPADFVLTAKNINLTGLSCPVELDFVMDGNLVWAKPMRQS